MSKNERLEWAVKCLKLSGKQEIAELGCGNGKALFLIKQIYRPKLLVGIDRSASSLKNAHALLGDNLDIRLYCEEFRTGSLKGRRFHVIFSINFNLFWTNPERNEEAFQEIKNGLKSKGDFFVFYQTPKSVLDEDMIIHLINIFESEGFTYLDLLINENLSKPAFGIHFEHKK